MKNLNDTYTLYKMASQLRKDLAGAINSGNSIFSSPYAQLKSYNNIRDNILKMFPHSKLAKNLPEVHVSQGSSAFIELHSATGQIISFLEGVSDVPDIKIEKLNNEITLLKEKNLQLEELNKLTSESLNKYITAGDFSITEEIPSKIPKDILPTLHDALRAYGAGSYTACVCVCRNIIQGLVQEQCAKEDIKEKGLNKQIEALISTKKIKQKHNQTLLDTVATLGHRSAHPTTEVFTKEKAALVLNGLLILIDEVFT